MKRIDIKKILKAKGIAVKDIAPLVCSENKAPYSSFDRIIREGLPLNELQINRLSEATGVPIQDLFDFNEWGNVDKEENKYIMNSCDGHRVVIDAHEGITKVYTNKGSYKELIINTPAIRLSEYLSAIDKIIAETE